MLVVLASALLGARLVFGVVTPKDPSQDERFHGMVNALPSIQAEPDHRLVLAFGASMLEDGFSPTDVDAETAKRGLATTSFNIACFDVTPQLLRMVTRRAANLFLARGVRADTAYVEFAPHITTRKMFERDYRNDELRLQSLIAPDDVFRLTERSPELAARLGAIWLLGWNRPGEVARTLTSSRPERSPEMKALLSSPAAKQLRKRQHNIPAWDPNLRGENDRRSAPEEIELAQKFRQVRGVTGDEALFRDEYDWLDLDFDPRAVEDFVASYEQVRRFADHVYVLLTPRPRRYVPSAIGRARLEAVLQQLRDRGLPVVSFFDAPEFDWDDFKDPAHLNQFSGRAKLGKLVAEHLASQANVPSVR